MFSSKLRLVAKSTDAHRKPSQSLSQTLHDLLASSSDQHSTESATESLQQKITKSVRQIEQHLSASFAYWSAGARIQSNKRIQNNIAITKLLLASRKLVPVEKFLPKVCVCEKNRVLVCTRKKSKSHITFPAYLHKNQCADFPNEEGSNDFQLFVSRKQSKQPMRDAKMAAN